MVVCRGEDDRHFFLCVGHDLLRIDVGRNAGVDFFGASVTTLAHGSGSDQAEHVKVGDEPRYTSLRQWILTDVFACLAINIVNLSCLNVPQTVHFVDQNGGENKLLLIGKGGDHRRDLIGFHLTLSDSHMVLVEEFLAVLLSFFSGDSQKVKGAASITVLLSCQSRTQFDDARSDNASPQPLVRSLAKDVLELFCIVRLEQHVELTEPRAYSWVKEIGEFEVVGNADDTGSGNLERGIHAREVVEEVVARFPDQMVNFIQDDDEDATPAVHSADQFIEDAVGWPSCEGDFILFKFLEKGVSDVAEHPVLGVDLAAVDHDGLDLSIHGLSFCLEVMAHVIRDCSLACTRDTVEGHVGRNMSLECFPEVVGNLLDFIGTMGELGRTVIVA